MVSMSDLVTETVSSDPGNAQKDLSLYSPYVDDWS